MRSGPRGPDRRTGYLSIRMYSTSEIAIMPVPIICSTSGMRRARFSGVSTMVTTMG